MRVALDVSAVPARPVGAGVYTIELARHLALLPSLDLHLVAGRDDRRRWAEVAPGATQHAVVPGPRPVRLAWEQAAAPRLAARLGAEVWHGPHYTLPLRLGCPAVVTVHDLTFFEHPEWHERRKVAFFRAMTKAAVARAGAVVAVSEATACGLKETLEPSAPVVVIPHGVDHHRFRADPEGRLVAPDLAALEALGVRPPYVAFVGTIEPRKAVPVLVEAFSRLAGRHPDLRLVLAGRDGWGTEAARAAVAGSGAATRVVRVRWVPDEALPALLRRAEAVAYPSYEEGFGLPVLEALACGAPVVTTVGSPMADLAGDAALAVPAGNTGALAWALGRLLDDGEERARLARAGPVAAARCTWAASAHAHLDVYRNARR